MGAAAAAAPPRHAGRGIRKRLAEIDVFPFHDERREHVAPHAAPLRSNATFPNREDDKGRRLFPYGTGRAPIVAAAFFQIRGTISLDHPHDVETLFDLVDHTHGILYCTQNNRRPNSAVLSWRVARISGGVDALFCFFLRLSSSVQPYDRLSQFLFGLFRWRRAHGRPAPRPASFSALRGEMGFMSDKHLATSVVRA